MPCRTWEVFVEPKNKVGRPVTKTEITPLEILCNMGFKDISSEDGMAAQLRLDEKRTLTVFIAEKFEINRKPLGLNPDGKYQNYAPRFSVALEEYPVPGLNDPAEKTVYQGESWKICIRKIQRVIGLYRVTGEPVA